MSTNSQTIEGSYLANKINLKGYTIANQGGILDREQIINNYSQETIDACWSALSINIIQNYQRGKGTLIKGFGVFTFKPQQVILEGTTNQYDRDLRVREPVFIISKELNENFCPGEYTRQNGIRYYTQKESKDISIVKINYAEMAYSISISKDELTYLLKHLFMHINESIINNTFKNKVFPGLGTLVNRNNIIAMKFDDKFINSIKDKTQKLLFTKQNIFLDLDMDNAKNVYADKCLTPYDNINDLKSKNSLTTKCEKSGRDFMIRNYRIDIKKYPEQIQRVIYNINKTPKNSKNIRINNITFKFINDSEKKNVNSNINNEEEGSDSALLFLDDETLKSIEYFKGIMIKNCKSYDTSGSGRISKADAIEALVKTNINNKIDYNTAKLIVNSHNKTENVEYMKFIAQLVKNSKLALLKKKNKKNSKTINIQTNKSKNKSKKSDINYNVFRRENFFKSANNSFATMTYTNGFFPRKSNRVMYKNNSSFKSVSSPKMDNSFTNNNKNNFQTVSCSGFNKTANGFYKRPLNINANDEEEKNRCNSVNVDESERRKSKSVNKSDNNNKTKIINFYKVQTETEQIKKYLAPIINLMPTLRIKYFIALDQKISSEEFMNILNNYNIFYPKTKIEAVLRFLGIPDIEAFSLREFEQYVKICKIIESTIGISELNNIIVKLKDIIYINGGTKFLFNNEINPKNTISCDTFIKILKDKVPYSPDTLKNVFIYLVKVDREFDMNDYINYFDNPQTRITFDESYYLKMMKKIIQTISDNQYKVDEYFDHLLLNNVSSLDKVITRFNWIKYLQKEKLGFSAEELDKLFYWIDTKKDGVIDREEFAFKYNHTLKKLTELQDIVSSNNLDIEDLAHHMKISISDIENYDLEKFKKKVRLLNYEYPNDFIKKLYRELIEKNRDKNNNLLSSKTFLDEINYVKPPENYKSFIQTYMDTVRNRITHDELKSILEKYDKDCLGTLTRINYVQAISNILPEYNDVDHMRFVRITDMFDRKGDIIYPDVLNLIFFYNKDKLSDPYTKLCQVLCNILKNECDNDVESLMYLISKGSIKKANSLVIHKPLTVEQVSAFLNKINNPIQNKIIQKLDIDADGLISFDDLKAVLKRFTLTSFFKYTNDSTNPNINLFSSETMSETKYKSIIKKLNSYMKMKNLTDIGLFKKFDVDDDGFISCIDFNKSIDDILIMSPAMKDQFFNYLDFYHNGLVDCETFMKRIKDFKSGDILVQNNNKIEIEILEKLKEFILKNNKLSDNEIFQVMDKDCDGLISINDLKLFIINNLFIAEVEFNKSKLERVMMSLSLSKNFQIGLNDIREFINLCNESKGHMNLKEVFKITTNQNLSNLKKNKEWTNDIIERLGMFVSEKYDSIEQFFDENSEKGTNKFTFNDFLKFHEKNYELFNNGFNLTKDELLSIFTSLDSHKKNFLTLQDLKNKLQIFNFYNKMHIDVKNFIQENFANGVDAFKFFIKSKNGKDNDKDLDILETLELTDINNKYKFKNFITLKEFFDTFENFFPNKYPTNTILKYLNKYFGITLSNNKNDLLNKKDIINFSEFNYLYFDTFKYDIDFIKEKANKTKLMSNREDIAKKTKNKFIQKSQNNFYFSNLFKKKFEKLSTPFDNDPLNKIKRILCSSKYNLNKFFESAAVECGSDKFIVNKYQFRNIIKQLDIGLTNLEIDQIMFQCGKLTYDNLLNLRDFIKYLYNQNYTIEEGKNNVGKIMGEIKSLIYKYYSNPIICFQNNDTTHTGKLDFDKFKNIVIEMYNRNEAKIPNFTLVKNVFDTIDLRKDGIIDMNEWCISFGSYNGSLDVESEKVSNGLEFFDKKFKIKNNFKNPNKVDHNRKVLREWETSGDVTVIYKFINKNRKLIKQKIKDNNYWIGNNGVELVHSGNLISILKDILPDLGISQTQWKMIVNIAKNERVDELIDINEFLRIIEITSRNMISHPIIKQRPK